MKKTTAQYLCVLLPVYHLQAWLCKALSSLCALNCHRLCSEYLLNKLKCPRSQLWDRSTPFIHLRPFYSDTQKCKIIYCSSVSMEMLEMEMEMPCLLQSCIANLQRLKAKIGCLKVTII